MALFAAGGVVRASSAAGVFPAVKAAIGDRIAKVAIPPSSIARGVAYAIEQPDDVEVGSIVIRPTAQD